MLDASEHIDAYHQAFGTNFHVEPGALASHFVPVLFTNRCGSMVFTEMLGSSPDIITQYEVFNGTVVRNKTRDWNLHTFPDYLARLFGRPRVRYTAKIHALQLMALAGAGLLTAFSGGVTIFRVRRRDQIAQAVSHSIARQTGQWTSFSGARGRAPRYAFGEIRAILQSVQCEQTMMDDVILRLGLDVRDVYFEDFLRAPAAVLMPAWETLGVRAGRLDPGDTRHRPQGTELNDEFIDRFRSDLARKEAATAA